MKCILFFSFIILVSSVFECPSGNWSRFRNKCYLGDTSQYYSFQENVDLCESLNATTASIHSEDENNFIKSKLMMNHDYWLGIRQVDFDANTYAWLDGSLYNYSNWVKRDGRKSCAGAYIENGVWGDYKDCEDTNRAFCQIDFDSPVYKMQSQLNQIKQELESDENKQNLTLAYFTIYAQFSFVICIVLFVVIFKIMKRFHQFENLLNAPKIDPQTSKGLMKKEPFVL